MGLLFRRKLDLCQRQPLVRAGKDIQLDDVWVQRDPIADLVDENAVCFLQQVFIRSSGKWKVILLPCHQSAAFVGQNVLFPILSDPDNGLGGEIPLHKMRVRILLQLFRKMIDPEFSFDFHL